jgi:hypothetical protein
MVGALMACKVIRYGDEAPEGKDPGHLKEMRFHCDADGCDVEAGDAEIEKAGGLRFMGWYAAGGKHFCPQHKEQGGDHQW